MKRVGLLSFFLSLGLMTYLSQTTLALGFYCGTECWVQTQGFCPTCGGQVMMPTAMPWGAPPPYYWRTGPMMYPNFAMPGPWSTGPQMAMQMPMTPMMPMPMMQTPGIIPQYFPGGGGVFAAKPNLYINGPKGTPISVKLNLTESGSNWLVSVPSHGKTGWTGILDDKNQIKVGESKYRYLYSDYRLYGRNFQDQAGFCVHREKVIGKMALALRDAGFTGGEIADFMEYWSVKMPESKRYCVYPQDERQLQASAPIEVTPRPVAIRRVLFIVQTQEGLLGRNEKFSSAPKEEWLPQPQRLPASAKDGIQVREWGVGFLAAKP